MGRAGRAAGASREFGNDRLVRTECSKGRPAPARTETRPNPQSDQGRKDAPAPASPSTDAANKALPPERMAASPATSATPAAACIPRSPAGFQAIIDLGRSGGSGLARYPHMIKEGGIRAEGRRAIGSPTLKPAPAVGRVRAGQASPTRGCEPALERLPYRRARIRSHPLHHPAEQLRLPLHPPAPRPSPHTLRRSTRRSRSHGRILPIGTLADRMTHLPAAILAPGQGAAMIG
jgi:hypothetical protein